VCGKGKKLLFRSKNFFELCKGQIQLINTTFSKLLKKVKIDSVFSLFFGTIQENNTDKAFFIVWNVEFRFCNGLDKYLLTDIIYFP